MTTLGQRIRQKRLEMKMSQEFLAQKMEKSGKQIVSNWETDRSEPSISDLRKLAELLGTTASWLIDGVEAQTQQVVSPPPGFVMMPADEVIEMQRKLLQKQDDTLKKQESQITKLEEQIVHKE